MRAAPLWVVWMILVATSARADDSCLVRGRVLGLDGKPLPKVRILPITPQARSTFPDREGRFQLRVPCGSARVLSIEAAQHQELMVPALPVSGQVLEFEARLRSLEWKEGFDSVRVIGEFNRYAIDTAVPMVRRRDGTFAATIDCQAESLRYQLLGVAHDGLPTAGTQADTLFLRAGRGISSVRAGRKPVELVFDPKRLPRSKGDATLRFSETRGSSAGVYPLFREETRLDEQMGAAYQAFVAAGGDRDSFQWDNSRYLDALRRGIQAERDPVRRQYMLLCYVRRSGSRSDSLFARRVLDEIPPESSLWGLVPGGPEGVLFTIWSVTGQSGPIGAYADTGSLRNADRDVRAGFLSMAISMAKHEGDKDRVGRYVTRMGDEFQGTFPHQMVQKSLAPNRKIRAGEPAPEVAFTALEDTSKAIRVSEFRGRHLLVDFWAVWCGPCRTEMPHLQRAWEAFHERGLEILSVSFDRRPADVAAYRRDKWRMPWVHAFATEGFAGKESVAYDVWGIPKPVLIGPDGMIKAEGDELRGDKLQETLAGFIGSPTNAPPAKK